MGYTLAEYKAFTTPGISPVIIDTIRKNSWLLDNMPFTDNGALMSGKWVYSWDQRVGRRSAAVRQVNAEYTPDTIDPVERLTAEFSIGGGSFTIDRVMGDGEGNRRFLAENFGQLTEATIALAHNLIINGDATVTGEMNGLDVQLAGTSTEFFSSQQLDFSTAAASDASARQFRRDIAAWLKKMKRMPDAFLVNADFAPLFSDMVAEWGHNAATSDEFGNEYETFRGIPFIDIGDRPDSADPIIPVEDRTIDGSPVEGVTDIYAVCFGPQEFHGVSPNDRSRLIQAYEPDFSRPGAVHLGEVEFVFTVALEDTRAAGVFRNIKVA